MTPRERMIATLSHRRPDRVPIQLGCREEIMAGLRRHYGVETNGEVAEVPVLLRRNAVIVAGTADTDLAAAVTADPGNPLDVFRATAAFDLLDARARVAVRLRRAGADVVEAPPDRLG